MKKIILIACIPKILLIGMHIFDTIHLVSTIVANDDCLPGEAI